MEHLQCERKEDIDILLRSYEKVSGAPSIASFVGKVYTENSIGFLYDVMEEMISVVNILLICALNACQIMRGWEEIG